MPTGTLIWGTLAVASATTLALHDPWTARLARGRYAGQVREHRLFYEANLIITGLWTGYFAAAAVTSAFTPGWATAVWAAPTPLLGWGSFRAGDWYAARRLRAALPEAAVPEAAVPATVAAEGDQMSADDAQTQLAREISGLSDQAVLEFAGRQPGGMVALVELTMAGMPDVLDPALAQDCVIGYEIAAPAGTLAYRIEVAAGQASVAHRPPDDARVVLQLTAADYLRLISGLADGTGLFLSGRMRIRGDLMFAPRVGAMFRTPAHHG